MEQRKNKFSSLTFDDFKHMAIDTSLTQFEKVGFPNEYRQGKEQAIFDDILSKVQKPEDLTSGVILDIGSGCSSLPYLLSTMCRKLHCKLLLVDSQEMLSQLDFTHHLTEKHSGCFPDIPSIVDVYKEKINLIICYSVIQYVFNEGNIWHFIDECLMLLAPGGSCLLGDIPNESKRKRFFSSETGITFHKKFMQTNEVPHVNFNQIELSRMDDSVIMAIIQRCRLQGFDAYIVPQSSELPMANRREDILITRP